MLTLAAGGGLLPLLAAGAGAARVTAVERSRMLYRLARQVLAANGSAPGAERVHLIGRRLQAVGIAGGGPALTYAPNCSLAAFTSPNAHEVH